MGTLRNAVSGSIVIGFSRCMVREAVCALALHI